MKTGLTKKEKITEIFYNDGDSIAEIYTHTTALKKRLLAYAEQYLQLFRQTDDNGHGGLRFEIDKRRMSIRLTPPPSPARREAASQWAKANGLGAKKL